MKLQSFEYYSLEYCNYITKFIYFNLFAFSLLQLCCRFSWQLIEIFTSQITTAYLFKATIVPRYQSPLNIICTSLGRPLWLSIVSRPSAVSGPIRISSACIWMSTVTHYRSYLVAPDIDNHIASFSGKCIPVLVTMSHMLVEWMWTVRSEKQAHCVTCSDHGLIGPFVIHGVWTNLYSNTNKNKTASPRAWRWVNKLNLEIASTSK